MPEYSTYPLLPRSYFGVPIAFSRETMVLRQVWQASKIENKYMYIHVRDHVHDILRIFFFCVLFGSNRLYNFLNSLAVTCRIYPAQNEASKMQKLTLPVASIAYLHQRNDSVCVLAL